jgi:hypothetical protein
MKRYFILAGIVLFLGLGLLLLHSKMGNRLDPQGKGFSQEVTVKIKQIRDIQESIKKQDPKLFSAVSAAIFQEDPAGINYKTNTDEYDGEATRIIMRLPDCSSVDDVASVIHEEFIFSFDKETAGPQSRYMGLAKKIWTFWHDRESGKKKPS